MTVEAELFNQAFSAAGSGIGGYFAGWGLGKVIKLALKVVAGAVGVFFGGLAYLQSQGFIHINWDKMQLASDNIVHSLVNSTVVSDSVAGNDSGIYHVVANLGIPMSLGIGMGFMLGITRGLRG